MEFMTGYYRQREDFTALLLQQYVCCGVPVCLGCVCGGESREAGIAGGQFTGRLLEKFRGFSLKKAVGDPEKYLKIMNRQLRMCREGCGASADFGVAGIMCIGERFLLFSEGKVKTALCNTGFGRPSLYAIGENRRTERLQIQWGSMEAGIGILLASESFYGYISQEDMKNCLAVNDISDSVQTQKRMQELGGVAESRGGRNVAALFLEVR